MLIIELLLGLFIGIAQGLLGAGGAILLLPILVYIIGIEVQHAVPISLAVAGSNAMLGTAFHWYAGHVRIRQALVFGLPGMLTAYIGADLSHAMDGAILLSFFAMLMLLIALLMLRPDLLPQGEGNTPACANQPLGPVCLIRTIVAGASVGILSGMLGVGGGFLIVPAMTLLLAVPMSDAVGTSQIIVASNSVAGLLGHLDSVIPDWSLIIIFLSSGLVGVVIGTSLVHRWSSELLRTIFAIVVVILAVILLFLNLSELLF